MKPCENTFCVRTILLCEEKAPHKNSQDSQTFEMLA